MRASDVRPALAPLLVAALLTVAGWHLMWFLTDDAYISFRYVSNWLLGHGLTWNPAPFHPVEGYSNFLWVVLLGLVWGITGVEPPDAANWLSLGLGLATLVLAAFWIWRMLEGIELRWRQALLAAALLVLATSRTFLTWLSSGLETALMNLLLLWWLYAAMQVRRAGAAALPPLCLAVALITLTRPDGLMFWAATWLICAAVWSFGEATERPRERVALSIGALLLPVVHLLWRRATYGDWLPNTYYAKVVAPWPEMGLRYLASFAIEHAAAVWLVVLAAALVLWLRRGGARSLGDDRLGLAVATIAIGTLIAHVGYYVLVVGGDHFEYRVFSHLVPLMVLSMVAALRATGWQPRQQLAVLGVFWLCGLAIPWVHWWHTHRLETRQETFWMRVPIAGSFPPPLRSVVAVWDGLQHEMIGHSVGVRHQEHKIFHRFQVAAHPPRGQGAAIPWSERHVLLAGTVGVAAWALPEVAVIDALGLNDRVIARAPIEVSEDSARYMAHDRLGSDEYLECFMPDLGYHPPTPQELSRPLLGEVVPGSMPRLEIKPRSQPLTDERIRDCESRSWY